MAIIATCYVTLYAGRGEGEPPPQRLAYYAIDAKDGLQVWRIGATKALDPDADVQLVYSTDQLCDDEQSVQQVALMEVRPVAHLVNGGLWRPGQLLLSEDDVTVRQLCGRANSSERLYWSTDSKDLKVDLERLGQTPAYYAAAK